VAGQVVVAAGARTPFGSFGGALRDLSISNLASTAAREAMSRAAVDPGEVDEMVLGVNLPGADRSLARQAQLESGIPDDRVSYTVDRACCSALTAISCGRRDLLAGSADMVVAGGAENLSKVPFFLTDLRWGHRLGTVELNDQLVISCPYTHVARAVQASEEGRRFEVTREEMDEWALRSQQRASAAVEQGVFDPEIVPIEGLERDESPRPQTTLEKLGQLPPVNGSELVTAGNAPGLSTGSATVVLMREETANDRGVEPIARILGTTMVSGHPQQIASIPAVAAEKVLAAAGVELADVDLIEVNEAFAVVPLITSTVLSRSTGVEVETIRDRLNVNGGAIALGHPTGATGARLLLTAALELGRRGGGIGLVTMCGGIGEGEAILFEVPAAASRP
jgi:acetyl-CoA C-acetyltransferase